MKDIASWALDAAKLRGASHAEARIVDERSRSLATKNGRIAGASDSESLGIGIRVIANGGFGFAATDDLSLEGVESCAARAVEIARASSTVKSQELYLVPEPPAIADWASPSADFCSAVRPSFDSLSRRSDTEQISWGKFSRLLCTAAGSTLRTLDGYGLRGKLPARPALTPCIRFLSIDSHI